MDEHSTQTASPGNDTAGPPQDSGLVGLTGIAAYFRIAADPRALARDLAMGDRHADVDEVARAAKLLGLRAAIGRLSKPEDLDGVVAPALLHLTDGRFGVYGGRFPDGEHRLIDPIARTERKLPAAELFATIEPLVVRVTRRFLGAGSDPQGFGFK